MSNVNFVPMYELERLNADQKTQYYRDACEFLGIPAHLNLLAFIFMKAGDTGSHEVLYAKKGATDFIRDNRGITTTDLQGLQNFVPGQVVFLAVGKDKNGREERAVGAAAIEGLTGKALSDAIMTAQTRATRRMTIQFVGGNVLDESELPDGMITTPISSVTPEAAQALDAIKIQPVVVPNQQPSIVEPPTPQLIQYVEMPKHLRPAIGVDSPAESDSTHYLMAVPVEFPIDKTDAYEARVDAQRTANLPPSDAHAGYVPTPAQVEAQAILSKVKSDVLAKAAGEQVSSVKELAAKLPADNPLVQAATAEPPKQRKRKAANEVSFDSQAAGSSVVEHSADNREVAGSMPAPPTTPVSPNADIPKSQPSLTLPAQAVEPPKVEKKLSPEEEKEIRARLSKYRNEILPVAGEMRPVEGIGGVEIQLASFVRKFNPEKPSSKEWYYADWLKLLGFFDDAVSGVGAPGLVRYMQQKIGLVPTPDDGSPARIRK